MKKVILTLLFLPLFAWSQVQFNDYFIQGSLRVDFELAGNHQQELALLQQLKQEPYWGGNPKHLIPHFSMGDYQINMKTPQGKLLYSKGFNSLFREWQTTEEAHQMNRSFHHAMQLPFPKDKVWVEIKARQKNGTFKNLQKWEVDPRNYLIAKDKIKPYPVDTMAYVGASADYLDIVFIAEGYTAKQLTKFTEDVKRFQQWIFNVAPFSNYKDKVNIYAILSPSEDQGPDVPGDEVYQNTLLNASFYTFNAPRYLTVKDTKTMYDVAALVPYDHVYVLVNTEIYGGAGFYNTYTSCASDCLNAEEIASHELAHGLIGLADEYYSKEADAISYYYALDIEPWEPNITTLVNFEKKWKHLVHQNTPIPTPREPAFENVIGAFEGGAYQSEHIYSPMQDCKMKSNDAKQLCPVCQEAVTHMLETYINEK